MKMREDMFNEVHPEAPPGYILLRNYDPDAEKLNYSFITVVGHKAFDMYGEHVPFLRPLFGPQTIAMEKGMDICRSIGTNGYNGKKEYINEQDSE